MIRIQIIVEGRIVSYDFGMSEYEISETEERYILDAVSSGIELLLACARPEPEED